MGDVKTHGAVTHFVRDQIKKTVASGALTDRDFTYLEIGNYLTDVSQFRDPPAHHKARDEIWRLAIRAAMAKVAIPILGALIGFLFAIFAGVTSWTDTLLGENEPGKEHGALAKFFQRAVHAVTHMIFAEDGLAGFNPQAFAEKFPELVPLPPDEVDRVFAMAFTQYWPHEHLDFPPSEDMEDHQEERQFRRDENTKMIPYLGRHMQFVAEELAKLELDMLKAFKADAEAQKRHDTMVRLGNLLHPIEDFFFHSNFVEIRQWQHVRRKYPDLDPATPDGLKTLVERGLAGLGPRENPRREKRLLFRRLRYPVYIDEDTPSDETSEDATEFVYTGGFGKTDIFHTIGSALESFEASLDELGLKAQILSGVSETAESAAEAPGQLKEHELILVRLLFSQDAREEMTENDLAEQHTETHAQQLKDGKLHDEIRALRAAGRLSERAEAELLAAFDLDLEMEEEWAFFPGVGGLLIMILDELERTRLSAAAASRQLDSDDDSPTDASTSVKIGFNKEATSEIIGTHSLLSKDSPDKQPLREDAVALANHASASVASILMRRVTSEQNIRLGHNWSAIIRYFLRFPRTTGGTWYNLIRQKLRVEGNAFSQPDLTEIQATPPQDLLGPSNGHAALTQLREGTTRAKLEEAYRNFQD